MGLIPGWLLYAIFLTGTASYFKPEITQWMQPEAAQSALAGMQALERARDTLAAVAPDARNWYVQLPGERRPGIRIAWYDPGARESYRERMLDAGPAAAPVRDSKGGEFFYRFHFELGLPYPFGRWLACFAGISLMVALVTGIIAHRRFFADLFTWRLGKSPFRSWLDFHNAAGSLSLPFFLMIGYTSLIMLMEMFSPWGRLATEPPPSSAMETRARPAPPSVTHQVPAVDEAQVAAPRPVDWRSLLAKAQGTFRKDGLAVERVDWYERSGEKPRIVFYSTSGPSIAWSPHPGLAFHALTGRPWAESSGGEKREAVGAAALTHDFLYGLHLGRFADPLMRGLFFFMGLSGALLIASGMHVFLIRRRAKWTSRADRGRSGIGLLLVERVNAGMLAGFPLAFAAMFWANRILPAHLPLRFAWEIRCFYGALATCLIVALLLPARRAWPTLFAAAALMFAALPLLDMGLAWPFFIQAWRTTFSAQEGAAVFHGHLGFDALMIFIGAGFAWAWRQTLAARRRDPPSESSVALPLPSLAETA